MDLKFLGGAGEVGRSGILLSDAGHRICMDYGVKLGDIPPSTPIYLDRADAVILSHAHLDHCGALPVLWRNSTPPLFTNDVTLDQSIILLKDAMKIAFKEGYDVSWTKSEMRLMEREARLVKYNEQFRVGRFSCQLLDAGHIPGSAGTLLTHDSGKRIFYTGDIHIEGTRLLKGATLPKKADILITESTYGAKDHPSRREEENKVKAVVEEALASRETTLFPVFAVGRAQEILLVLEEYADRIALDGMAKEVAEAVLGYPYYVREPQRLKRILSKVFFVRSDKDRRRAADKYPIIVTTAGMATGGPVVYYLRELRAKPRTKVVFVGYLAEDTPARILLETGVFRTAEEQFKVQCDIRQFDFSAHAGRTELFDMIRLMKPKKVFAVHGDSCRQFADDVGAKFGIETYGPENGDTVPI